MNEEYHRLHAAGWRFAESGGLAGHLNIRMGREGRALYDSFRAAGVEQLAQQLCGQPLHLAQAIGNLNLPGSCAQDFHIDGAFAAPLLIANVCLVPTDASNGATALVAGSHAAQLSYWRFSRAGWRSRGIAPSANPGDVLLRWSNLWHRGMPNRTAKPRPMAAFTFALGPAGDAARHCTDFDGPLTLFANKYHGHFRKAKELLAVRLPLLDEGLRQARSLLVDHCQRGQR